MSRSEIALPYPGAMDRSPLYEARDASRCERQALIRQYDATHDLRQYRGRLESLVLIIEIPVRIRASFFN